MSQFPHEISEDFPEFADQVAALRASSPQFAARLSLYDALNKEIYEAETNIHPTDDIHLTELRKRRMVIKDEIYALLKEVA